MRDQELLEWYLSYGETLFERSPTGAILDLIAMRAYTSRICPFPFCHHGIIEGAPEGGVYHDGDWCPKCKGTGSLPVRRVDSGNTMVTARPTHSCQPGGDGHIEDDRLSTYALISRRLRLLHEPFRSVLVAAYGVIGCAYSERGVRSLAVVPITPQGKRLLASYRNRHPSLGGAEGPDEIISRLCDEDALCPVARRSPLLAQARQVATLMLEDAVTALDQSVSMEGSL